MTPKQRGDLPAARHALARLEHAETQWAAEHPEAQWAAEHPEAEAA